MLTEEDCRLVELFFAGYCEKIGIDKESARLSKDKKRIGIDFGDFIVSFSILPWNDGKIVGLIEPVNARMGENYAVTNPQNTVKEVLIELAKELASFSQQIAVLSNAMTEQCKLLKD
jgi:hypothetical protein